MGINKDQVQGRAQEVQGKVKEVIGKALGNKDLEVEGSIQKNAGVIQASVGKAKEAIVTALRKS